MSRLNKTKSYTFLIKKIVYGHFQKKKKKHKPKDRKQWASKNKNKKKIEIDG